MATITITVPTINDESNDFETLFGLWSQVNGDNLDVSLDFSPCRFLRQNAVAFLGGLIRMIQSRGGIVRVDWNALRNAVRTNLEQNGFRAAFDPTSNSWLGNSIPFRQDRVADGATVMTYLKSHWLGRGWVNVSAPLRDAIVGRLWEAYANAFEHGESVVGVFSCGQHYPRLHRLKLSVVDFGIGIPCNVRRFGGQAALPADKAMEWAFRPFTTTKPNGMGRGMGLDLLKNFIRVSKGRMEVFSHDGHAIIDADGENYRTCSRWFEGTLVNITLVCDDSYYCLASEIADNQPLF